MKKLIQIQTDLENRLDFQGIDLTDSFILNWYRKDSEFVIDLELSVWPESPYYENPKDDEVTCYKKGILKFYGVNEITGLIDLNLIPPSLDPDGSKDWEGIYDFQKEGNQFRFRTEFTEIEIQCDGLEITLED